MKLTLSLPSFLLFFSLFISWSLTFSFPCECYLSTSSISSFPKAMTGLVCFNKAVKPAYQAFDCKTLSALLCNYRRYSFNIFHKKYLSDSIQDSDMSFFSDWINGLLQATDTPSLFLFEQEQNTSLAQFSLFIYCCCNYHCLVSYSQYFSSSQLDLR